MTSVCLFVCLFVCETRAVSIKITAKKVFSLYGLSVKLTFQTALRLFFRVGRYPTMQITCPYGRFLQGIYKSDEIWLQNLKLGKCCKPEGHPDSWGECYNQESDKSNTGWKKCKEDYHIVGVEEMYAFSWRCRSSPCIKIKLKCCRMKRKYLHLCFDWSQVVISTQCVKFGNVLLEKVYHKALC